MKEAAIAAFAAAVLVAAVAIIAKLAFTYWVAMPPG
jgi:hypothetical protein